VESKPGRGATFKISLPRAYGEEESTGKEQTLTKSLRGSETVLVAEDDDSVQDVAQRTLQRYGYNGLSAQSGEEALRVSDQIDGPIHLLLTDVIMPGMSGHELGKRLQSARPEIKVVYMSGYTDNAISHHGVLDPAVHFMEKPFSPEGLARKVREVLDASSTEAAARGRDLLLKL